MKMRNLTLEMSPKPFRDMSKEKVRQVCVELFQQWAPLTRHADVISVMLWTADGSEILDYRGKLDEPIEWARYIGYPNAAKEPVKGLPLPEENNLHSQAIYYIDNPPILTYRGLATIVRLLKQVGHELTGKPIRVGATFDPGGEFAHSSFKYKRHNEICLAGTMGKATFVCCYARLNADKEHYAGFPNGIPQDTPLGTFLGRQSQHFLKDLGFDYIWFSNGFGFGMETWKATGPLFDGKQFFPENVGDTREKILQFWKLFRAECPKFGIETRGTNLVTGSDLASNAMPLKEIYEGGFDMVPPPNSPWAALNGDFGLELVGYMSRIAELPPGKGFPFRFYTHDPWWLNSPWLDRYGREPHDIYLPLAIGRINAEGRVENPDSVAMLTVDDSYGRMPEQVPNEVIPHLQEAMRHAPDRPGPLVWVYPFDEYCAMTFAKPSRLEEPFFGDWLMRAAVNNGLPLNTVVSTKNFLSSLKSDPALYRESILVTPVPDAGSALSTTLIEHARNGGRVLLYGPIGHAGRELLAALNLKCVEPIAGELILAPENRYDELTEQPYPKKLQHRAVMSAGGVEAELAVADDPFTHVVAGVSQGDNHRVAALWRPLPDWHGGLIAWVRGTNSNSYTGGHLLTPDDPTKWFSGDLLLRFMLAAFDYRICFHKRKPAQRNPVLVIARQNNGFFFSGGMANTNVELRLRLPQGAPLFTGTETELHEGAACYRMPRAWHRECRVFVEQEEGELFCAEQHSGEIGISRRLHVTGLMKATVRFYPEHGTREKVRMIPNPASAFVRSGPIKPESGDDNRGHYLQLTNITGRLLISW